MATVVTPTPYVDGATLVPDLHNQNIASSTPGEGIMSEPNGGIEVANLDAAFKIAREHVQIGEACRSGMEAGFETCDYVSNAFSSAADLRWAPIGGTGIRFYLPYSVRALLIQWSVFVSPFRVFFIYSIPPPAYARPNVVLKAFYNNAQVQHTHRRVPCTAIYDQGGIVNEENEYTEDSECVRFDMAHMVLNAVKGWHNLSVRLHMEAFPDDGSSPPSERLPLNWTYWRVINGTTVAASHQYNNRVTVGIRNVRYFGA